MKLTAAIDPAAAGTVTFKNGSQALQTVDVADGKAEYTATGLQPGTEYTFNADFAPADTAAYEASTVQLKASTKAKTLDQSDSDVNVTVPNETTDAPGDLTISVKPGASIPLKGASDRPAGADWEATGALGNVTVNDDRRDASGTAWSLNGKLQGPFTSGENSIAATAFGWTPKKVSGVGSEGAADTDFTTEHALGTGNASADANQKSTFDADLKLTVPSGTPGGDYTSKLTLTLI